MFKICTHLLIIIGMASLLAACASHSPAPHAASAKPEKVPRITLNLPSQNQVECEHVESADYTFLEKGYRALARGDHVEAVRYFQRYQRLEESPVADWEAGIAIAYDSMLPQSPFYA